MPAPDSATETAPTATAPRGRDPVAALARLATVEARCAAVARSVMDGRSSHFKVDAAAFERLSTRVCDAADDPLVDDGAARRPSVVARGDRWAALQVGGVDRVGELRRALQDRPSTERWLAEVDLVVLLALLDSEAALGWSYEERTDAVDTLALPLQRHDSADLFSMLDRFTPAAAPAPAIPEQTPAPSASRAPSRWRGSAGLAVATVAAFRAGVFSASRSDPCRADAAALAQIDATALRAAFQVGPANSLPALEARAPVLAALGRRLAERASDGGSTRLSRWVAPWLETVQDARLGAPPAEALLAAAARLFNPAFGQGPQVLGLRVGDTAAHAWAGMAAPAADAPTATDRGTAGWVPFHLGLQSMVRSLQTPWLDARSALGQAPLGDAGEDAAGPASPSGFGGIGHLCDLSAERHVAWLLDTGVLVPRAPADLTRLLPLGDGFIVEARALAVHLGRTLLSRMARGSSSAAWDEARRRLEHAIATTGRELATERRGGSPAVMIQPDGGLW